MERREVLKHAAVGMAGLGSGYVLVEQSTEQASAALSMGELNVSDASKTTDDGTISAVTAEISGSWQYDLPSGKNPKTWEVSLNVSDGENADQVASDSGEAAYLMNNGEYSLSGTITDTSLYSTEDFAAPDGKVKKVTLGLVLVFTVTSESGDTLARSQISDTGTVEHTNNGFQATEFGELSGSGSLGIKS